MYISLGREGIDIISHENKKETLKKASPILKERLNSKFKNISEFSKRVSKLTVEDDNCIGILKDKNGHTLGIIN